MGSIFLAAELDSSGLELLKQEQKLLPVKSFNFLIYIS